jgi:hypothetical protein
VDEKGYAFEAYDWPWMKTGISFHPIMAGTDCFGIISLFIPSVRPHDLNQSDFMKFATSAFCSMSCVSASTHNL